MPTDVDYAADGVRLLNEVDLFEVSIVAIPMNPKAQIAHVKSRLSARGEYVPTDKELAELKRDAERHLRSKGFSRVLAMQCAKNLFIELAPSATPESKPDHQGEPDGHASQPSATPDDLEVIAGLTGFKDRMILQDLAMSYQRIFRR